MKTACGATTSLESHLFESCESSPPAREVLRSSLPSVRNPLSALPAAARLQDLDPQQRAALRALLLDLRRDAMGRAQRLWSPGRKYFVAGYWAVVSVYAGHIARMLRDKKPPAAERQ